MSAEPLIWHPVQFNIPAVHLVEIDAWSRELLRKIARDCGVPRRWLTYHRMPKRLRKRARRESLAYLASPVRRECP